ncbi:MAG: PEP/pyruvate-binding domain-containing protein [Candidatus Woesearchaeota archaeon]
MNKSKKFILWFDQMGIEDVPYAGGKNASLGEMYSNLTKKGVMVPNGFAVTAYAYRYFLDKAGIKDKIKQALKGLNTHDMHDLRKKGEAVRQIILNAELPQDMKDAIVEAYKHLCIQYSKNGENTDVAVRSSATAEDLPDASFAGQQETYLNIKGNAQLIDACRRCIASLFTNRAISYRVDKHFDHFSIALSIGVQKMVRSDKACSGVMFSIDTESGFKDVAFVTASYGLGENVVQGAVNPDEYYVFKPTLMNGKNNYKPIISKKVGEKKIKMIYCENGTKQTKNIPVSKEDRKKFVLTDDEILILSRWACIIEDHYSKKAGHLKPMDMEWAKDGVTGKLFIVQARPETVQSQKDRTKVKSYKLTDKRREEKIVATGKSVGDLIGQGPANIIKDVRDIHLFNKGQVLVTDMTDPDWEPIMKIAGGIVTNRGGRTCFTSDTMILTNKGFRNIKSVCENYEGLMVPSLNKDTLKLEWKPVIASMKSRSNVIEVAVRNNDDTLKLTPDHKMITFENNKLIDKKIIDVIRDNDSLLTAISIPTFVSTNNLLLEQQLIINLSEIQQINSNLGLIHNVKLKNNLGEEDVYNITIADNHNYIVFTDRLTPIVVNNCHAAIISRELGIPCIVGTNDGTQLIKQNQKITIDCASGDVGNVYDGLLKYRVEEIDLKKLPKTKTKIMMNLGNPEEAFELSFMPNEGIGLAREEFIINSYIKVHPMALINFNKIKDSEVKKKIEELTYGYQDKKQFFVDKLAHGVGTLAAAFYPKKVILRFSDFKTNEYANLLGGKEYEPVESNPMIGWRGASRYYKEGYKEGFALECKAIKKVREEFGLTNLEVMIPICRTVAEGKKVLAEMAKNGLKRGSGGTKDTCGGTGRTGECGRKGKNGNDGLKVNVMCEVPSNAILADQFLEHFDGFSIGSNDLTQFTLACDRDSELVADIYDERNEAVKRLIENAITVANKKKKYIGICGQAPSDFPDFAQFLVRAGIHSMSLNPDSIVKTTIAIKKTENQLGIK